MSAYIEVIKLQQLHLTLELNTNLLKILAKSDDSYKEFSLWLMFRYAVNLRNITSSKFRLRAKDF